MPRRVAVESGRRTAAGSRRARIVTHAEYSRKRPKTTTSAEVGTTPASDAPASAPAVVGTSRKPSRSADVVTASGRPRFRRHVRRIVAVPSVNEPSCRGGAGRHGDTRGDEGGAGQTEDLLAAAGFTMHVSHEAARTSAP